MINMMMKQPNRQYALNQNLDKINRCNKIFNQVNNINNKESI